MPTDVSGVILVDLSLLFTLRDEFEANGRLCCAEPWTLFLVGLVTSLSGCHIYCWYFVRS